jgi:uncharacterized protein DUF2071/DoxX-like protein
VPEEGRRWFAIEASAANHVGAVATAIVASVWLIHGLFNKLLHFSPRHLLIVQSVPGLEAGRGEAVLAGIGVFEVGIAVWVLSGWAAGACAAVQTVVLLSMNIVELSVARSLLLWPAGLIPINLMFLGVAWVAAGCRSANVFTVLRRHPLAVTAHFRHCLTLTYALPPDVVRRLLPPGLTIDTHDGHAFVAVALVQAESLRPAGLPAHLAQDFFLAGYRVFTTFTRPDGRRLRGLRILRSDADGLAMVIGGNLLTHYNYHHCKAAIEATPLRLHVEVSTTDDGGALDVVADLSNATLPPGSPFRSVREARRFAGPLPFTFDYERETGSIIAIRADRANWRPLPVSVDVRRIAFFEDPVFEGCTPVLAAAFYVRDIDYRWERGVRYSVEDAGA